MRPCTPLTSAPAPRESAIKPVPHHAAPVGRSSQTRRHHLTPTPVQRGGAKAPERDKTIFSLPPGAAHSLFVKNKKRMGGAPLWEQPLRERRSPLR